MEFSKEFIQEIGLSEEQVAKISEETSKYVSQKEDEWSSVANTNAEKIIEGAIDPVIKLTGITREKGQKAGEYLKFASENYFKGQRATLERKELELNEKIKSSGGDSKLIAKLEETETKLRELKEKEAKFAEWEENDYKGKYEQTISELSSLEHELAFNGVKPQVPENINKYEFQYKWDAFIKETKEKNNIEKIDGEYYAIDKINEFKKTKLSELVKKDQDLISLTKGETKGIGSKAKTVKFEGVPFDIPENATSIDRARLIREYLAGKGLDKLSKEYAAQYAELNQKVLAQKTAT